MVVDGEERGLKMDRVALVENPTNLIRILFCKLEMEIIWKKLCILQSIKTAV